MAVIISDSRNPNYNQMLSTTNGFYRSESYNIGADNSTNLSLSTTRFISLTLENSGNMMGVCLGLSALSSSLTPYTVKVELEENVGNVTFTINSPCVATKSSHGFIGGEEITISTTGTLPTGLNITTKYFIKYIDENTFNLSTSLDGTNINTSGTQSGTHTIWQNRLSKEMLSSEINPEYIYNTQMGISGINNFGSFVPFKFDSSYAVTTDSNKWRFKIFEGRTQGSNSIWSLITSDGTNAHYATWCDNQITSTDGDVLYVVDKIIINKSFTTGAILGVGSTVVGVAACICRSGDLSKSGTCMLEWENPPSSSYTFTISGLICMGKFAGFRVGSETSRIPFEKQAIINRSTSPAAGTAGCGFNHINGNTASRARSGSSLFLYGEIPDKPYGILLTGSSTSQSDIILTEDLSSYWSPNDYVYIGKQNLQGQGTTAWQQILSITGNTITLTSDIITYSRLTGGYVINRDRGWGITMLGASNSNYFALRIDQPRYNEISGVKFENTVPDFYVASSYYNYPILPNNKDKWLIEDNLFLVDGISNYYTEQFLCPPDGVSIKRNIGFRFTILYNWISYYIKTISEIPFYSGVVEFKDNLSLCIYSQPIYPPSNGKSEIEDNTWQNSSNSSARINISGIYQTIKRNKFWGIGSTGSNGGVLQFNVSSGSILEENSYDNCNCVYSISASAFVLNSTLRNEKFDIEMPNTNNLYTITSGYYDITLKNPNSIINIDTSSDLTLAIPQSRFNIVNESGSTNSDRTIVPNGFFQRCGYGLTDSTSRLSSNNNFSLRFEPSIGELCWEFDVPTSNIQNKSMSIMAWIKINSINYYSGSYEMPKLSINYDDDSIISGSTTQTTDWQLITISFTPLTETNKVSVKICGETDQTGSDAYFYVDDISILYPPGHQLNLGSLDVWDKSLPVTPPISTSISALDIWMVPTESINSTGTVGKKLNDNLTTGLFIALN